MSQYDSNTPAPQGSAGASAERSGLTQNVPLLVGLALLLVAGVIAFFVLGGERPSLLVNEIAPRVHNSGHWTEAVCLTDQFGQHIRAVAGWPLGDPARTGGLPVEMRNLIGAQADDWHALLAEPGAHLHLYGKGEARPGRKMGHVTRLGSEPVG